MQTPPSDEMKQAKKAFKANLKAYLSQFDEKLDTPDVSQILRAFKPVIFQESMGMVGKRKSHVAKMLGVNRGILSKTLIDHPKPDTLPSEEHT
ncbi:hypothetical protein AB4428_06520 [Vibrio lentus]